MAAANLLALLDDIATILDDVSIMTKVAVKKTAGVLGDDLALNAEQVSGVKPERELAVVWAVFKGSLLNKFILVPAALLISAFIPVLIGPLLILGGLYLSYEGVEKVWHKFAHKNQVQEEKASLKKAFLKDEISLVNFEKDKIKGAIRTDFILSAEIIVIALGTVAHARMLEQVLTISVIALLMTVGVYGLVALIVKLDDIGLHLKVSPNSSAVARKVGAGLLAFCPWLMKFLSIAGTVAMFLVGGGIIAHGIPFLHHALEGALHILPFGVPVSMVFNLITGLVAGSLVVAVVSIYNKFFAKK